MKTVRVICITHALRATEAEKFKRKFSAHFDGKFVFSGRHGLNGSKQHLPLYHVVRETLEDEPVIDRHEMSVERGELLERIGEHGVGFIA